MKYKHLVIFFDSYEYKYIYVQLLINILYHIYFILFKIISYYSCMIWSS